MELAREAAREVKRAKRERGEREDGASYTRTRKAIHAMFGREAFDRCKREGAYALLDGMRFLAAPHERRPDELKVQTCHADWQAPLRRWDWRAFVTLPSAAALVSAMSLGKPELDPIPPVVDEEVI